MRAETERKIGMLRTSCMKVTPSKPHKRELTYIQFTFVSTSAEGKLTFNSHLSAVGIK